MSRAEIPLASLSILAFSSSVILAGELELQVGQVPSAPVRDTGLERPCLPSSNCPNPLINGSKRGGPGGQHRKLVERECHAFKALVGYPVSPRVITDHIARFWLRQTKQKHVCSSVL